jgi:hypothetical protein
MTIKEVLENPETPATVLIVVAVDLIGEEVLQYDIDAIVDTFADVYKAQLPNNALDKIQAMQTIYTTDIAYHSVPAFIAITDALSGDGTDFENADMPHVADIAWAITELLLNDPPEGELEDLFSPDIKVFIRSILDIEGFTRSPKILKFAGDFKPVEGSFMDDEMIFGAHYSINSDLIQDVEDYLTQRAKLILDLIDLLPLSNRDPQSWSKLKPA